MIKENIKSKILKIVKIRPNIHINEEEDRYDVEMNHQINKILEEDYLKEKISSKRLELLRIKEESPHRKKDSKLLKSRSLITKFKHKSFKTLNNKLDQNFNDFNQDIPLIISESTIPNPRKYTRDRTKSNSNGLIIEELNLNSPNPEIDKNIPNTKKANLFKSLFKTIENKIPFTQESIESRNYINKSNGLSKYTKLQDTNSVLSTIAMTTHSNDNNINITSFENSITQVLNTTNNINDLKPKIKEKTQTTENEILSVELLHSYRKLNKQMEYEKLSNKIV